MLKTGPTAGLRRPAEDLGRASALRHTKDSTRTACGHTGPGDWSGGMVPGDRPEPALGKIRGNTLALAAAGPQRKKTSRRRSVFIRMFTFRGNGVICYGISRRFLFVDCMGKIDFTDKIVVNINLLGTVAAGLVRGMDNDFLHKSVQQFGKQFVRYGVLLH